MSNIPDNNRPDDRSLEIELVCEHPAFAAVFPAARPRLDGAARLAAAHAGRFSGLIEISVVTDATIHRVNREHLQHDWPTDVISFVYDASDDEVEGEVIVSWDTAVKVASDLGVAPQSELELYVIHGVLHLCGYDDLDELASQAMRDAEAAVQKGVRSLFGQDWP